MKRIAARFLALALVPLATMALLDAGASTARSAPLKPAARAGGAGMAAEKARLVDLNSASKVELVKLPGVGEAIADRIIAGRPWVSKYDLVVKKVVTRGVYDKFARLVVARQPASRG